MNDYIPVISAAIAGFFAAVTGVIAWKLKTSTDERARSTAEAKERQDDLKRLYADIFVTFEQAIHKVQLFEEFNIDKEVSNVNARVRLFASKRVIDHYQEVAQLLTEWAILYANASPRRTKVGDQTMVVFQAPDPTAKYRVLERESHQKLQEAIDLLVTEMRGELANEA